MWVVSHNSILIVLRNIFLPHLLILFYVKQMWFSSVLNYFNSTYSFHDQLKCFYWQVCTNFQVNPYSFSSICNSGGNFIRITKGIKEWQMLPPTLCNLLTFQTRLILEKKKTIHTLILCRKCKPIVHTVQLCNREQTTLLVFQQSTTTLKLRSWLESNHWDSSPSASSLYIYRSF